MQKLRNIKNIPPGTLLVSLDVSSLYTNIPNKEAIHSIAKTLAKYRKKALHPTNQSIIQLLELVLTRNNFEFNGFEEKNVYTHSYQPKSWVRYIDDILAIFTEGREKLNIFLEHLNSCHENIKFTVEISDTRVTFLHTVITQL